MEEVVQFSAGLRISSKLEPPQLQARVKSVIKELGLFHVSNSIIRMAHSGTGISGEIVSSSPEIEARTEVSLKLDHA